MTECSRCGACCENIWPDGDWHRQLQYLETGLTDGRWRSSAATLADATFVTEHWHPNGSGGLACDRFDPVTRLCTVYEGRPPVCRGYPYYGDEVTDARCATLPRRCSFRADAPTLRLWLSPTRR